MSESDLIEKLAAAVASRIFPSIPLEADLWDIAIIAAYTKRDPATVRERWACLPSFPKAIRLPSLKRGAQALYKATEIIKWAESHMEKN